MTRDEIKVCYGPGWHALIDETIDKIEAVYDRAEIVEAKKVGNAMRLMVGILPVSYAQKIWDITYEAMKKSEKIEEQ